MEGQRAGERGSGVCEDVIEGTVSTGNKTLMDLIHKPIDYREAGTGQSGPTRQRKPDGLTDTECHGKKSSKNPVERKMAEVTDTFRKSCS